MGRNRTARLMGSESQDRHLVDSMGMTPRVGAIWKSRQNVTEGWPKAGPYWDASAALSCSMMRPPILAGAAKMSNRHALTESMSPYNGGFC